MIRTNIWILFVILLVICNFTYVNATLCNYCGKDFTCIGRHAWRCKAKVTSTFDQAADISINEINSTVNNASTLPHNQQRQSIPAELSIDIKCVCGRLGEYARVGVVSNHISDRVEFFKPSLMT